MLKFQTSLGSFLIELHTEDAPITCKNFLEYATSGHFDGTVFRRGSLSMARTNDPDSATSQFFVNLKDNAFLDPGRGNAGYAVFAHVMEGMDVVDKIAAVKTGSRGMHEDVPVEPVVLESVTVVPKG